VWPAHDLIVGAGKDRAAVAIHSDASTWRFRTRAQWRPRASPTVFATFKLYGEAETERRSRSACAGKIYRLHAHHWL